MRERARPRQLVFVMLILASVSQARAGEVALSLNDAIDLARRNNAHLRQSEIDIKLADLALLKRKLAYIDLNIDVTSRVGYGYQPAPPADPSNPNPSAGGPCPPNFTECWQPTRQAGLHGELHIPIWSGFENEAKLSAARFKQKSAAAAQQEALRKLVIAVGQAYWEVRKQELTLAAMHTLIQRFREFEQLTLQKVNAGLTPLVDYNRAHAQTLGVELKVIQTESALAEAHATLAQVLQSDDAIRLTEPLPEDAQKLPSLDEAVRTALAERPDVVGAEADVREAAQNVRAAKNGYWPHISVAATADYLAGTDTSTAAATTASTIPSSSPNYYGGLELKWNIFGMMKTWMDVREAGYQRDRTSAQGEILRREVIKDVRSAHAKMAAALRSRGPSRRMAELARTDVQLLWRAFSVGASRMLDVIEAQNDLMNNEIQLIERSVDLAQSDLNLQAAMGRF